MTIICGECAVRATVAGLPAGALLLALAAPRNPAGGAGWSHPGRSHENDLHGQVG